MHRKHRNVHSVGIADKRVVPLHNEQGRSENHGQEEAGARGPAALPNGRFHHVHEGLLPGNAPNGGSVTPHRQRQRVLGHTRLSAAAGRPERQRLQQLRGL